MLRLSLEVETVIRSKEDVNVKLLISYEIAGLNVKETGEVGYGVPISIENTHFDIPQRHKG